MNVFILISLIFLQIIAISCSRGDNSGIFRSCLRNCHITECLDDDTFLDEDKRPLHLVLLNWGCRDECKYTCMWKTIDDFKSRDNPIPQFYGKWPFVRILGLQEPASVLFSLLNIYVNFSCIKQFRKNVRSDSPMYWVWHGFCAVCLNAWFWSTVFHARDFPLTEFLDYSFAFSIMLMNCYCMFLRVMRGTLPRFFNILVTALFAAFYLNHIYYLSGPKFDYGYNMAVNIIVGSITVFGWFAWSLYNRFRLPYVWKAGLFFALFALSTLLEIVDTPPWFYLIDCHALWHFTSAPITYIIYSFIIDDCKYLRKQVQYADIENVSKTD